MIQMIDATNWYETQTLHDADLNLQPVMNVWRIS